MDIMDSFKGDRSRIAVTEERMSGGFYEAIVRSLAESL
jgi:hypothetical protein